MPTDYGDSHRRGAVAVIPRQGRLLVIRRSRHVVAPGKLCFPGGGMEGEETETEALRREMREELGVEVLPVRRLWRSVTPWRVPLAWWLGRLVDPHATLRPDPREVDGVEWLAPREMLRRPELLESNRHFLAALASGEIALDLDHDLDGPIP